MQTKTMIQQLRDSQAIYAAELARYEELTDAELDRVLGLSSGSTIDSVLGLASGSTIDSVLGLASGSTIDRVLGLASGSTIDRVLGLASGNTIDSVLGLASGSTIARLNVEVPIVENLDGKMLEVATSGNLDMTVWHCGTTHCRAGWAITFAGEAGQKLEATVGPEVAGRLIYEASTGRIAPNFFARNKDALEDIKRCAGVVA